MKKDNVKRGKFNLSVKDAITTMKFNEWTPKQLLATVNLCDVIFDEEQFLREINEIES